MDNKICNGGEPVRYWRRPDGPLNIWRIVECVEKQVDGTTKNVRISIQDIPKDRHEEALRHMYQYYMADELTFNKLKIKEDPVAANEYLEYFRNILEIGITLGAFKLGSNNELLELVGVNLLYVTTKESEKAWQENKACKSSIERKFCKFVDKLIANVNVFDMYGVDKYISSNGLSVAPAFRGQKLGLYFFETRDDIGEKYGIYASWGLFSTRASQIQGERAGFKCIVSQRFDEVKDEDGIPFYTEIGDNVVKIMVKQLKSKVK